MNRLITAKDYSKDNTVEGYFRKSQKEIFERRGIAVTINAGPATGVPVLAEVWQGQWVARCECNGMSFVDPDEPIFFCFSCGNYSNGSRYRPVEFPQARQEIESLLLERPVVMMAGLTELERVAFAKAEIYIEVDGELRPLVRSWQPGETVEELSQQQSAAIDKWKKEKEKK